MGKKPKQGLILVIALLVICIMMIKSCLTEKPETEYKGFDRPFKMGQHSSK